MFKTGDLNKNLDKLTIELKQIKYPDMLDVEAASNGDPRVYLPILHFTFLVYSNFIAQHLADNKYVLSSKSDKEFIEIIYKALQNLFNYNPNPTLKKSQFFSAGSAESKAIFCVDVIRLIKKEHNDMVKKHYASKSVSWDKSNKVSKISAPNYEKNSNDIFSEVENKNEDKAYNQYHKKTNSTFERQKQKYQNDKSLNNSDLEEPKEISIKNMKFKVINHGEQENQRPNYNYKQQGNSNVGNYEGLKETNNRDINEYVNENENEYENENYDNYDYNDYNDNTNKYNNPKYENPQPPVDLSNNFSPKFCFEEKDKANNLKNNIIDTYNKIINQNSNNNSNLGSSFNNNGNTNNQMYDYNFKSIVNNVHKNSNNNQYFEGNLDRDNKKANAYIVSNDSTNTNKSQIITNTNNTLPINNNSKSGFTQMEFSTVINIINELAASVKTMTTKIETFKTTIEEKVGKLEAEMTLVKNRVTMLELNKKGEKLTTYDVKETKDSKDDRDVNYLENHVISFADEQINVTSDLKQKKEVQKHSPNKEYKSSKVPDYSQVQVNKQAQGNDKKYISSNIMNQGGSGDGISGDAGVSPYNNYNTYSTLNNQNTTSNLAGTQIGSNYQMKYQTQKQNFSYRDKEDTDGMIDRISNRFRETQKLLEEMNK